MSSQQSFIGTGWSFPPRFTEKGGSVEMVSGNEDIQQSLDILLSTQLGERVMREDFGCDLTGLLFEEVDQGFINSLTTLVTNAILYFEPRILVNRLDVSDSEIEDGLLLINIDYTVNATNSRYNMVYPFYINEAAGPGP